MKNKKTVVYGKIKERIINGTLAPGSPINESDLARDLDVSKTPVRESLRQLEREGLVENIPGRGSAVTHITFQDIREIFEIREIIECGVAKRVALMHNEEDLLTKKNEVEKDLVKAASAIDCASYLSDKLSQYLPLEEAERVKATIIDLKINYAKMV